MSPHHRSDRGSSGRSELGVALLLGAVGVVVLVDAPRLARAVLPVRPGRARRPCRSSSAALLLVVRRAARASTCCAAATARPRSGEDVDLTHPTEWRVVLPLVGVVRRQHPADRPARLGDLRRAAVLGQRRGRWAAGTTSATRSSRVALSLVTFYGFYLGLGIHLPAGVLEGVL